MKFSEMLQKEINKKYWGEFARLKTLYPDFTNKRLYEMLEANQEACMYSTYASFRVAYCKHLQSLKNAEQI
jgi:hypothetical protein